MGGIILIFFRSFFSLFLGNKMIASVVPLYICLNKIFAVSSRTSTYMVLHVNLKMVEK